MRISMVKFTQNGLGSWKLGEAWEIEENLAKLGVILRKHEVNFPEIFHVSLNYPLSQRISRITVFFL